MRIILRLLISLLFFANALCLLIAVAAPYISPEVFWVPALFGLFFKVFFFINLAFTLYFVLSFKLFRLVSAFVLLVISFSSLKNSFAFHSNPPAVKTDSSLTILTYNVESFDWYHDSSFVNSILNTICASHADIVCLQEYYIEPSQHKKNVKKELSEKLGYQYYFEYVTDMMPWNNRVGQAVFSRFPLEHFSGIPFTATSNGAFYVDVQAYGDTFRLFNVHFQSIGLNKREYEIPKLEDVESGLKQRFVKMGVHKIRDAFRRRSYQAGLVEAEVEKSPYDVVLCGDFNDTPVSYLYHALNRQLDDSWLKTGFGLGSTYAGDIPFQRIDYVLLSPTLKPIETKVIKAGPSDHYPVLCRFGM